MFMKRIIAIIFGLSLLGSAGFAQQTDNKGKLEDAKKKAADERSRGFGARRTHTGFDKSAAGVNEKNAAGNESKNNVADNNSDKSGTAQSAGKSLERSSQVIQPNNDQSLKKDDLGKSTDPNKSNAPAVIQTTTSESGSPAILSDNNGSGRDGTNNIQRGTMKMAGAEVTGDMGLFRKDNSETNIQTPRRIRKQEEQPARITARPTAPQSQEDATVQEKSTQGETAVTKEPAKKESKKQKGKAKKSRRNKDRDSGK